jgi:hypothetical protein
MGKRNVKLKKQRERFLLERFIHTSKLNAQIVEDREAPDFVVRVGEALVGVEVTELFVAPGKGSSTPQAQEAVSSQIAVRAQCLYQAAGGSPAHVTVCFGPGQDLRGLNRDKSAQMLCDYVLGLNLSPWQRVDWRPEELDGPLPYEISFVHALGVPSSDMAHWDVTRAGWVAPLNPVPLQERIDEKAKRLPKYQRAIAENWLLIVADAMRPSSLIEAQSDFDAHAVQSPFSRTFFYRHPDRFFELATARI